MPCLIKSIHCPLNTILRQSGSNFHLLFAKLQNELHTLRNNSCQKSPQKGEKREILINKNPQSLSSPPSPQSVEAWHAAQRSASTYSEYTKQTGRYKIQVTQVTFYTGHCLLPGVSLRDFIYFYCISQSIQLTFSVVHMYVLKYGTPPFCLPLRERQYPTSQPGHQTAPASLLH